jgi:hypothetical protein
MVKLVRGLYKKADRFLKAKINRYKDLKKSSPFIVKIVQSLKTKA